MVSAGIDMGSKSIKVAVLSDGAVSSMISSATGFGQGEAARELLFRALADAGIERTRIVHIAATGMGRGMVDFADSKVTDITAAARAAAYFFPGAETVIEVGAEESRGIRTDGNGKVLDSAVNDKCAAGSGSFTESMARALGMELKEFGEKSLESEASIPMNAQCTVFAESEVVSLIHQNTEKKDIARAVHEAIATRVGALVRRVKLSGRVVLLGGLARNPGFRKSLMENLEVDQLLVPENPEFASAVGAALIAAERGRPGDG